MKPKTTFKERSNTGKASAGDAPSPFELAQTAIALYQLRKEDLPGNYPQPEKYFQQAKELLTEARSFLQIDWKEHAANVRDSLFAHFPKSKAFSFDELLEPSGEKSKGKKSRTWLGTITKENGLKKAIRRYFPKSEAAQIITGRTMSGKQVKLLMAAQRNAVQQRAAKRVKRVSG